MPRYDGKGPMGRGAKTGRGLGACNGEEIKNNDELKQNLGLGLGLGHRGGRKGGGFKKNVSVSSQELLKEQKEILQRKLDLINEQLESM